MESYNVELLPIAYCDLDDIFDYIMLANPSAATKMLDKIMNSLQRLEIYPYSGVPFFDHSLKKFQFRMLNVYPYIAFYRIIDKKVLVYRILHGARDCSHLLKNI